MDDALPVEDPETELERSNGQFTGREPVAQIPEPAARDEEHQAAEAAARIEADRVLLEHLRQRGFTGPSYLQFESALVDYALPVMKKWMRTGEIFKQCRQQGRPVHAREGLSQRDRDDRHELASLTVAHALKHFRDHALIKAKWRPTGDWLF
ncbi:hypothetical protein ACFPK5_40690 [Streptomyces beijiangensis]|uniref:hypothetical protein n=1 Tax=Streptomyces beijiangensis TaxID=163361 RepID=UPI0036205151